MKKNLIGGGFLALMVAFVIWLRYSGLTEYFTIDYIIHNKMQVQMLIQNHYWYAVGMFILTYLFLVTFAVPVTIIMNLAGGLFFGFFPTILYALIGATIGSVLCFLAVRYALGNFLREKYAIAYQKFDNNVAQDGVSYLLMLHFFPVTPFAVINILAGLSSISVSTFTWATALGMLPPLSVYTFAGRQLQEITSTRDILSWPVIIALSFLAALSLIPMIARKFDIKFPF